MAIAKTKNRPRNVGRPSDRKNEVVDSLRHSIISGALKPGVRMPTREEIVRQFSASPVTVNSALSELRDGGFVEVRGKTGTFVAGSLPHQTRYAVAFGQRKDDPAASGYFTALAQECARVHKTQIDERELEIVPFYDLDRRWDSPDYVRLMDQVRAHRIGGIIAANNIRHVIEADDVIANNIPVVVNVGKVTSDLYSTVTFNEEAASKASLDFLASRGVLSPAFLFSVTGPLGYFDEWLSAAVKRDMVVEQYRIQMVHLLVPSGARNSAHVMMMLEGDKRPDGLVIADDNLVPFAIQGLRDAGVADTDDFPIVAHANFPWPTPCSLPALRVGYDLREMIRTCVETIDRMRANGGVVEHRTIAPLSIWNATAESEPTNLLCS
ncbi:MAG TPA: GntR family transcriptional regulator [Capsulimonadaceae bacterium]|jgi:DNA-binding LacI/PurR family transcriptional regulator